MKSEEIETSISPLLIPIKEAIAATGVGRDQGYALGRTGEWPSVVIGGRILVSAKGLSDWADIVTRIKEKPGA